MLKKITNISVFFSFFYLAVSISQGCLHQQLDDILKKAGDYCHKLDGMVLHFVCSEKIKEKIYHPYKISSVGLGSTRTKTEINTYVYDYQLIRKGKIIETRILLKENGISINREDASIKTKRFKYEYYIFGPIGLFSHNEQKYHDYVLEKETKLWGVPVFVVKAVPKNPSESDWLFGKAWIDMSDGSVLKIEWEDISIKGYESIQNIVEQKKATPKMRFVTEYKFKKNGIRFPSESHLSESYVQESFHGRRMFEKSELNVEYKDYKFFTVETDVTIKRRI